MSLKPVLVVIPQRTLRFLSATRIASTECPPVLVAKKQGGVCQLEGPPPRTTNGEEEEEEEGGGASEEEGTRFDDVTNMVPSRAVKHKAVEKRRKKKISEAIQQILEILRPPSPTGKLTRADILEIAVDKIKTLKEENEALKSKIDALPEPGALELSGELSKHILEYVTLRTQLQRHIEMRQQLSCDQMTESHDSVQRQTVVDNDSEEMSTPSQIVVTSSSSLNDLSMGEAASCNVRTRVASLSVANASSSIGNEHNTIATEAPPLSQEAPPTNQPWPVTSILSRVSNCRYTGRNEMPVGCHGDISSTNRASSSSPAVQRVQPIGLSLPPVSMSSALAPPTSYLHNEPSCTVTCSARISSITSTSGSQRCNIQTQLRNSRNVTSSSTHVRSELGTSHASRHAHYHHHRQHAQQRHHSRDGYHGYTPDAGEYYDPPTALQPNTPSIVQPWVESHQRPRLHHMTKTTPTVSPSSHYPLQHHHHDHSRHGNHSERFMPYPSTAGRANIHNTSTFSSGSWSHGHHVTSAGSSSSVGQNIAPLGGTYASMYGSHYHPQHQHHFTPHPSGGVSTDYSNYSLSQGHLPPFYQTQHSTVRSSNMMSHDSAATPPYPIQPHPHTGSNSSTAVWRPYSERSRLSGFYLSDILSLPSEPEAPPLQMEPTPPTGHRGIQSFQVNRLLEDI